MAAVVASEDAKNSGSEHVDAPTTREAQVSGGPASAALGRLKIALDSKLAMERLERRLERRAVEGALAIEVAEADEALRNLKALDDLERAEQRKQATADAMAKQRTQRRLAKEARMKAEQRSV